jgi:hypothetical protein
MFKQRVVVVGLLLAIAFGVSLGFTIVLLRGLFSSSGGKTYNTAAILQQVQTLSQLVTVKYVIEKVEVLDDVRWNSSLGESRVLLIAHGVVKAGLDLSQIQPQDLQVSNKQITIKLPLAQITDAYLDEKETRVVERTTGLLRRFDKDLESTARQNAVDDIRRAARSGGILKDAEDRARAQLSGLFKQLGYEEIEFRTH